MPEPAPIPPEAHRRLAAELFNRVWSLLDQPQRSAQDDDTMLHAAHASRYHWELVGQGVHLARGDWQVSRVYATLGRSEPALYHAQRCLDHCRQHALSDFDLACAYEALARAAAVAGQLDRARRYRQEASQAAEQIGDPEDRQLVLGDLATIPGLD